MINPPHADFPLFSVTLVRRASAQSQVKESGSQKSGHYNLKRLSMDFSQAPSSPLWYGKASENFEVQVRTTPSLGSLQRRLSQIATPSKLWREDNCGVERCHDANGDTDAETIGNFNHVPVNTRHGRRASHRHTYNLPNTKFCLGKDQVVIDYVDDNQYTPLYPQLPLTRCPRVIGAQPKQPDESRSPPPNLKFPSRARAWFPAGNSSNALSDDNDNRNPNGEAQASANWKSRSRPLTQCFKRAKPSGWLDKAGKRMKEFKTSTFHSIFKKHTGTTDDKRISLDLVPNIGLQPSRRKRF
ncbi:hypothetical protein PSTT_01282 [Puccinia striiformis]|uniref:Uncharacterized protein n=1 Tax=Puccinia striiformis TaxID=27350 RepID=A0A2S4W421_9BASI|nr:hypothetical protein PSTT_01282 [Puccinia striiformis]